MFNINKFAVNKIKDGDTLGIYEIGPFARGYGTTVGISLRRIMYSSISGIAVTSVKVNGAYHEYSTLTGVQDDVLMILLKLKKIIFTGDVTKPTVLSLHKKGKTKVLASDLVLSGDISILNPDLLITELTTDKANLELELTIETGRGYSSVDEDKRGEVSLIPVDSDFSPIIRLSHKVEATRLGNISDLEKLIFEIETNGSVSPIEVLTQAVEQLNIVYSHFVELLHGKIVDVKREFNEVLPIKKVDLSIEKLNISTRLYNCLDKIGIKSLMELEGKSKREISEIKGLGEKSKKELLKVLEKYEVMTQVE